jgi:hypothetical protein
MRDKQFFAITRVELTVIEARVPLPTQASVLPNNGIRTTMVNRCTNATPTPGSNLYPLCHPICNQGSSRYVPGGVLLRFSEAKLK